jgi:hypothetical protein
MEAVARVKITIHIERMTASETEYHDEMTWKRMFSPRVITMTSVTKFRSRMARMEFPMKYRTGAVAVPAAAISPAPIKNAASAEMAAIGITGVP